MTSQPTVGTPTVAIQLPPAAVAPPTRGIGAGAGAPASDFAATLAAIAGGTPSAMGMPTQRADVSWETGGREPQTPVRDDGDAANEDADVEPSEPDNPAFVGLELLASTRTIATDAAGNALKGDALTDEPTAAAAEADPRAETADSQPHNGTSATTTIIISAPAPAVVAPNGTAPAAPQRASPSFAAASNLAPAAVGDAVELAQPDHGAGPVAQLAKPDMVGVGQPAKSENRAAPLGQDTTHQPTSARQDVVADQQSINSVTISTAMDGSAGPGFAVAMRTPAPTSAVQMRPLVIDDHGRWVAQLATDIASLADGERAFAFQLRPRNLGNLMVEVQPADNRVEVVVTTETRATLELMAQSRQHLHQELRQQITPGLAVHIQFKMGDNESFSQRRPHTKNPDDGPRSTGRLSAVDRGVAQGVTHRHQPNARFA